MEVYIIEESKNVYRIRKESEGCTVFSSNVYLEGNETMFLILKEISKYGVEKGIMNIINLFDSNENILTDLLEFSNDLIAENVLLETAADIKIYCNKIMR